MVYDSMAAWDRRAFDFTTNMLDHSVIMHHSFPMGTVTSLTRDRRRTSTHSSRPRSKSSLSQSSEPSSPSPPAFADDAPSFVNAKSQWSPPSSPRTRSLRIPSQSSFERKDSAMALDTPPLSPKDLSALADNLYAAACAGDTKHMKLLLSLGAPINTPTMVEKLYESFKPAKPGLLSALAGAAEHGQLAAVRYLLANGAALNPTMRQSSSSPLHQACRADNVDMARFLLEAGADVDSMNCFNTTPLMYAAKYGSVPLVSLLLSYKPDLHRLSFINTAAIHWSMWPGNEDMMELLLQAGADPDHAVGNGSTPLHYAAVSELPSIARVLLMYGANPLKRNEEYKTPLQVAVEAGHFETAAVLSEAELRRQMSV